VDERLATNHSQRRGAHARKPGLAQKTRERGWQAAPRGMVQTLAVVGGHIPERRLAQPQGPFEHRIEHRRKVSGRGIDDV
jgi:hypothetical protein